MLVKSAEARTYIVGKQPVHQSVYEELRALILFGDLAPGQPVTIQGIAQTLGAGMTPVREAIRRMLSAGALTMMGNRRVIVPVLTGGCIEELDFMRGNLEPELAGRAAEHITPDVLGALTAEDTLLNQAIANGDISAYLAHNYRFHAKLYATAQAPIIALTVDRLWLRFGPSLRVVCGRFGTANLPDKHADLLQALTARDRCAVEIAMAEDVEQGMQQIRAALNDPAHANRFD
ncbi:MAG: GntR family transcriptional regulator [Pseudomonadota bacterium]